MDSAIPKPQRNYVKDSARATKLNEQAIEIVRGTRKGTLLDAEKLYLQSAQLGDGEAMYRVACFNMGGYGANRKDYNKALYWLNKALEVPSFWQQNIIEKLLRIYKEKGDNLMISKYQSMLDSYYNKKLSNLIENSKDSERGFYRLVWSLYYGQNAGIKQDKKRAIVLLEEGIKRGYRSLYEIYSEYLYEKKDERYLFYLLEYIRDTEIELGKEYQAIRNSSNREDAENTYRCHKETWLPSEYCKVATAYLEKKDVDKALTFIKKSLGCDNRHYKTIYLLAKIFNGEYGSKYINYDDAIRYLNYLPLRFMDDKYPNALMGDAYIGKSEKNYIIAEQYYNT